MRSILLLVGLALGAGLLSGCPKKEYPVIVPLSLVFPVTLTPSGPTVQVGDTLWIRGDFSDSLLDYTSGRRYRVQPQDMAPQPAFFIEELHGRGVKPTGFASTFQVVSRRGPATTGGEFSGLFSMPHDGHAYHVEFGLVPTRPGITAISLLLIPPGGSSSFDSMLLPFIQLPPDAQGREQKAGLHMLHFFINNGQANNYDLFQQYFIVDPETTGAPAESLIYRQKSTFTVQVR